MVPDTNLVVVEVFVVTEAVVGTVLVVDVDGHFIEFHFDKTLKNIDG